MKDFGIWDLVVLIIVLVIVVFIIIPSLVKGG